MTDGVSRRLHQPHLRATWGNFWQRKRGARSSWVDSFREPAGPIWRQPELARPDRCAPIPPPPESARPFPGLSPVAAVGGLAPAQHPGTQLCPFASTCPRAEGAPQPCVDSLQARFLPLGSSLPSGSGPRSHPPPRRAFFFKTFFWALVWPMEVPRLGVESEQQPPAYVTATAAWDPSQICNLR